MTDMHRTSPTPHAILCGAIGAVLVLVAVAPGALAHDQNAAKHYELPSAATPVFVRCDSDQGTGLGGDDGQICSSAHWSNDEMLAIHDDPNPPLGTVRVSATIDDDVGSDVWGRICQARRFFGLHSMGFECSDDPDRVETFCGSSRSIDYTYAQGRYLVVQVGTVVQQAVSATGQTDTTCPLDGLGGVASGNVVIEISH